MRAAPCGLLAEKELDVLRTGTLALTAVIVALFLGGASAPAAAEAPPSNDNFASRAVLLEARDIVGAQSVAGAPDRGFGIQGSVVTDLQGRGSERCFELLVQPDRKLVCVGQSIRHGSESEDVALVRYLPNGQLDQSFGVGGVRLFDSGLGMDDIAATAVLAPDGKIVVAGVADVAGADRQDFLVARFNPDGSIDSTFGSAGFVTTDGSAKSPDLDWGRAVALQPDGKIVVAGQTSTAGPGDRIEAAVLRYLPTGELDRSFGADGRLAVSLTRGSITGANSLLIQPDGKLVIGSSFNPAGSVLARLHPDGRADGSFGSGGMALQDVGVVNGDVVALMRQTGGKIVAVGWGAGRHDVAVLARFHANGRVDRSFGTRGHTLTNLVDGLPEVGGYAAALQADGKIVVAGGSSGRLLIARYLKDGKPDVNFGGIGFVTVAAGRMNHGYASAVRIQADGRIVAAGAASRRSLGEEDFALVRLEAKPAAATRFASFTARTTVRRAVISWRTRQEVGARRFMLFRQHWGRLKLVGQVPARGSRTRGATYALTDRPRRHSACCPGYWLVEVKRNGRKVRYGPVAR
jgi:uncharacterized delta-60 repeat protein